MMKPVTTSAESSSQGKLDGQSVVNASTTTSSNTKTHKHWVQHIWREVLEIGFVILYLALSFAILETFKCATLLARCSENDFLAGYATAGIAALGLGKFVFVLEKMKISKRFEQRPLIVPVVYKSVLFTILVNVILHVEGRIMHHEIAPIPSLNDPVSYLLCFSAHQVGFLVTFFPFFCLREINRSLGEGRLYKLFFVSRDA
ncbi:MAG: hypothetical protein K2Z81_21205 [Cyanobacteria bacterium]|nr:hypothetical protein [Cyanobacteriota bacterium]